MVVAVVGPMERVVKIAVLGGDDGDCEAKLRIDHEAFIVIYLERRYTSRSINPRTDYRTECPTN